MPSRKKISRSLNKNQKLAVRRQVKALITRNQEIKFTDKAVPAFGVTAGGTIDNLWNITQGNADSQRLGDEIKLKRIRFKYTATAGDSTNYTRVILFQWTSNSASVVPSLGAILQNTATTPWLSELNDTNMKAGLFRVVYDKLHSGSTVGSNYAVARTVNLFGRRLPRKNIEFNPTLTSGFNQFYYLVISDSAAAPNPNFAAYIRVEYVDS